MKKKFLIIADWYCAIVACVVTLWWLCFFIFGGEINAVIHWDSFSELLKH